MNHNISESNVLSSILSKYKNTNTESYEKEYELYFLLGFHYPELFASLEYTSNDNIKKKTLNINNFSYDTFIKQSNHNYTESNQSIRELDRRKLNFIGNYNINYDIYNKLYLETLERKRPEPETEEFGFPNNSPEEFFGFHINKTEKFGFNKNKNTTNSKNIDIDKIHIKLDITKSNKLVIHELKKNFMMKIPDFLSDCKCFAKIKGFTDIILFQNSKSDNNDNNNIISLKPQCSYTKETKQKIRKFLNTQKAKGGFMKYRKNTKFNKRIKRIKRNIK